jgi:hypothetical protein
MGDRYLPAALEKNPGLAARRTTVCGEDAIYISICSGGATIKISASERSKFVLGQRHSNFRSSVGRTDTLAGKLNASEVSELVSYI